ncbi:carboxylesterase 4A-like [Betta splendens]|uniref:Carboxylesterase 4A-like n=1 Tax=Betta splendens TaxID=158456 RepID=A0A9W2XUQ6_BETSP|nr:carboxylesterase 4A-like [Betta splendens]
MSTMKFSRKQTLLIVASVFFLCVAADLHAPEVHTKLGSLRSQYVSVKGKETGVHAYLGVPFAKPPVGPALRLAAPQPVEGWEGVKDATQQPPITGDQHMPGNVGLLDQVQALRWIQQHIHSFGGDPGLVTVGGQAAGGISASLLLLSLLSHGLFHRAIAESGSAAMHTVVSNNPLPMMQIVANASGCSHESTERIADCIRNLDINTIVTIGKVFAPQNWTKGLDREQITKTLSV